MLKTLCMCANIKCNLTIYIVVHIDYYSTLQYAYRLLCNLKMQPYTESCHLYIYYSDYISHMSAYRFKAV